MNSFRAWSVHLNAREVALIVGNSIVKFPQAMIVSVKSSVIGCMSHMYATAPSKCTYVRAVSCSPVERSFSMLRSWYRCPVWCCRVLPSYLGKPKYRKDGN